ncbi:conserved hypothetical protein [Beutenbergia cavernae DSM 12333]|uniref:Nitroreductase n=1 Tax=Beutenbergia cavernae (strain ATCC BAA-8 / DSM 12333 / CCUG 43141 / JCM 11478 / NBRC 16432 / NCIMB 13614 / HKI 0122) TaxID=471853 RepID=C5C0X1_BEUC1|nr:nitroreductase family deazaflavin-dependent oxidoreductase [Beutenbergia cavernae]ACQ79375.1 conserved hypothetical protein [Beutenbergia cavernae DSM 12333]
MTLLERIGAWSAHVFRVRALVRAPIPLFRWGLGVLVGGRYCWLEHRGRRSGLVRSVVLEVVDRPADDVVVVASGFGTSSQWYRNLQADPRARLSVGSRYRVPARARLLDADDSAAALRTYAARHPRDWQLLLALCREATGVADPDIPCVELRLRTGRPGSRAGHAS